MKKRIMALFLAMAMVVTATACGKGYKVGDKGEVYNDFIKIKKWKELDEYLLIKYIDGNVKRQNEDGSFKDNGNGKNIPAFADKSCGK